MPLIRPQTPMNQASPTIVWTVMASNTSSVSQSLDTPALTSSRQDLRTRMDPARPKTTAPSDQRQTKFAINTSAFLSQRIRKVDGLDSRRRTNKKAPTLDIQENANRKIALTLSLPKLDREESQESSASSEGSHHYPARSSF